MPPYQASSPTVPVNSAPPEPLPRLNSLLQRLNYLPHKFEVVEKKTYSISLVLEPDLYTLLEDQGQRYAAEKLVDICKGRKGVIDVKKWKREIAQDACGVLEEIVALEDRKNGLKGSRQQGTRRRRRGGRRGTVSGMNGRNRGGEGEGEGSAGQGQGQEQDDGGMQDEDEDSLFVARGSLDRPEKRYDMFNTMTKKKKVTKKNIITVEDSMDDEPIPPPRPQRRASWSSTQTTKQNPRSTSLLNDDHEDEEDDTSLLQSIRNNISKKVQVAINSSTGSALSSPPLQTTRKRKVQEVNVDDDDYDGDDDDQEAAGGEDDADTPAPRKKVRDAEREKQDRFICNIVAK